MTRPDDVNWRRREELWSLVIWRGQPSCFLPLGSVRRVLERYALIAARLLVRAARSPSSVW